MNEPRVVEARRWVVGGFEETADFENQDVWRKWREIHISVRLEQEVRVAIQECFSIIEPLVGGLDTRPGFNSQLLLDEACVNLTGHGKKGLPNRPSEITFSAHELDPATASYLFRMTMEDDLPLLDLSALPDPTWDENLEEITGRGIMLIRKQCRARITQKDLPETGGKRMQYEWRHPSYSLKDVGYDEDEPSAEHS